MKQSHVSCLFKSFEGWKNIPPSLELWSVFSHQIIIIIYHHPLYMRVWENVCLICVNSLDTSKVKPQPYVNIYIKASFFFIQMALWEIGAFLLLINPLPDVRSRGYGCMCVFTGVFLRYHYIITVLLLIDYIINIYIYIKCKFCEIICK